MPGGFAAGEAAADDVNGFHGSGFMGGTAIVIGVAFGNIEKR